MNPPPYKPVSCDFVDYIEHSATLQNEISITFKEGERIETILSRIKTWFTKDNVEFLVLEEQDRIIRMDFIISLDGHKPFDSSCGIK